MATREEYIQVDGLVTKVLTFGGWIDDPIPSKHVILCITGNPGVTGYYKTFMATLNSKLGIPVWVLSQAGHELPKDSNEVLKNNLRRYNLVGQIQHKIAFIKKYIPEDVKITFIGHSIGCKMILSALKHTTIDTQVDKCYFLFPTIERMAVTPNGKFLIGKVKPFVFLIVIASWLFHILPFVLKKFLISCWFMFEGTSTAMSAVTVKLVRPKILRNVFYLAMDEMDNVTVLDPEPIEKFGDKLVFYYGATDNWAPLEYCRELKTRFPNVRIIECEKGFDHSFVLNSSTEMGIVVADMIKGA